jgi:hypothetical protein
MAEEKIVEIEKVRDPTKAEISAYVEEKHNEKLNSQWDSLNKTLTIIKAEYKGKLQWDVEFSVDSNNYKLKFNAAQNAPQSLIEEQIKKYFVLSNAGFSFNYLVQIPTPTPEEEAEILNQENIKKLKDEKDLLKGELLELQRYAENLQKTKGIYETIPTEYTTIETTLQTDLKNVAANFIAKLEEYRTAKEE